MTVNRLLWLLTRPRQALLWLLIGAVLGLLGWHTRELLWETWVAAWAQVGEVLKDAGPEPSPTMVR